MAKVKVKWMPRQTPAQQQESHRRAQQPIMGKPSGNYSPMESFLRLHETEETTAEETVELMAEFQQRHIDKSHRLCVEKEIAVLRRETNSTLTVWVGCVHCGNVRTKQGHFRA